MQNTLVKPIIGILTGQKELCDEVLTELSKRFGVVDIVGDWIPFDHTNYYADEMGENLFRCFVSFGENVESYEAVNFKSWSKEVEERFMKDERRAVNIDPGYLDANKVVLITGKHGGHKIALAKGVFADMLLWYNKGWAALPWAFPDFRDGRLFPLFTKMRTKYKSQTSILSIL